MIQIVLQGISATLVPLALEYLWFGPEVQKSFGENKVFCVTGWTVKIFII